ncbi:MAG: hypothetical protein ACREMZ_01100 [Gemmatimonadales bacterium]
MLLPAATGCRAHAGRSEPGECQPVAGRLDPKASADEIAGEYRLTLVNTAGARQGPAVSGRLWLEDYKGELRELIRPDGSQDTSVAYAAFGATDVDLSAVGAVRVGTTMSRDPLQPGVVVLVRRLSRAGNPATEVTLRLGSEANRRDLVRFDGGYTALYVREISGERLAGDWSSGAGMEQAQGHFCATRVKQ